MTQGRLEPRRLARLAALAAALALGILTLRVLPIWLMTWVQMHVPRSVIRGSTIGFLQVLRAVYALAWIASILGLAIVMARLVYDRRRGRRPSIGVARVGLLGVSVLVGLALMEASAAAWLAWAHRLPALPSRFPEPSRGDEICLAVVGESSALGTPYDPWVSVGQLVAWQLERTLPGRRVRVEMLATGGICLEQAVLRLGDLKRRPDAILVYAGHNEFQARFGWSRNVRHYREEGPVRVRSALAAWAAGRSPLCALVAETIEKNRLDTPPPPHVTRALVDHPAFTPEEYDFLRSDFERRLDGVAAFAERIGALPILVIPPGNDAGFPPDRSYLRAETSARDRDAFARAFEAVRASEATDPAGAIRRYRDLLERQPGFAESHFRLARLLERAGAIRRAEHHYRMARDLDGMPMRCPSDFQAAYRRVARRHDALLIDGPAVLRKLGTSGLLDDRLFHDAQHPTFRSYVALADHILNQLHARRAFGWPADAPNPALDPAEAASHFGLDATRWAAVCDHSASFYARIAYIRFDPSENLRRAHRYAEAARRVGAGTPLDRVGIDGLGPLASKPAPASRPRESEAGRLARDVRID